MAETSLSGSNVGVGSLPGVKFLAGVGFAVLGLIIGVWGAISKLVGGHELLGTNDQIPWGVLVPSYVFFVAASAGCVIVALGYAMGIKQFAHIMKRAIFLAILTLIAGGILIFLDLGSPQNAINFMLSPNIQSPMWWMSFFYTLYLIMLCTEFYLILAGRTSKLSTVSLFTAFSAIAVHSTLGSIFGLASVRSYFGGALSPVYFILIAILIGTALLLLVTILHYKLTRTTMSTELNKLVLNLGKFLGIAVAVGIFFTIWKIIAGIRGTVETTTLGYQYILSQWWYWVFVIIIGLIIPVALLLNSKIRNLNTIAFASFMVLIGMYMARVEFTLGGQVMPVIKNLVHPGFSSTYMPSIVEISIVTLAVSLVSILYLVGARGFQLEKVADHD